MLPRTMPARPSLDFWASPPRWNILKDFTLRIHPKHVLSYQIHLVMPHHSEVNTAKKGIDRSLSGRGRPAAELSCLSFF